MKRAIRFLAESQGTIVQCLLAFIVVLFLGILVGAYVIARRANPVFLDEQGHPVNAETPSGQ